MFTSPTRPIATCPAYSSTSAIASPVARLRDVPHAARR